MPRYSIPSTRASGSSGPVSSSRGRQWTPSWTFNYPARSDPCRLESTWRDSTVPEGGNITKTDALKKYHLRAEELSSLSFTTERYNIPGKSFRGTRRMYNEREIERRAWRKYGSPSHFERFLREAFSHYRGRGPFQYPPAYRPTLANDPQFVAQDVQPRRYIPLDYDSLSVVQQVVFDLTGGI